MSSTLPSTFSPASSPSIYSAHGSPSIPSTTLCPSLDTVQPPQRRSSPSIASSSFLPEPLKTLLIASSITSRSCPFTSCVFALLDQRRQSAFADAILIGWRISHAVTDAQSIGFVLDVWLGETDRPAVECGVSPLDIGQGELEGGEVGGMRPIGTFQFILLVLATVWSILHHGIPEQRDVHLPGSLICRLREDVGNAAVTDSDLMLAYILKVRASQHRR